MIEQNFQTSIRDVKCKVLNHVVIQNWSEGTTFFCCTRITPLNPRFRITGWPTKKPKSGDDIFSVQDVHPNLITYNGFMDVCQKTGEWRVALQLLEDGAACNVVLLLFFFKTQRSDSNHQTTSTQNVEGFG